LQLINWKLCKQNVIKLDYESVDKRWHLNITFITQKITEPNTSKKKKIADESSQKSRFNSDKIVIKQDNKKQNSCKLPNVYNSSHMSLALEARNCPRQISDKNLILFLTF
jgi:hypothetical protein